MVLESDHTVLCYTFRLSKTVFPPRQIHNSIPPSLTIFRSNFIPPFIKSAFFLYHPQNSLPPTHRKNYRSLKSNVIQRFFFNTSMYLPWPSNSSKHGTCIPSPSARFTNFPVILTFDKCAVCYQKMLGEISLDFHFRLLSQ